MTTASSETPKDYFKSSSLQNIPFEVEILLSNQVYLKREQLNSRVISFLRENLNFLNSDFIVKKNLGKSIFNVEKYFRLIEETSEWIIIPRGFVSNLVHFLKREHLLFRVIDNRNRLDIVDFDSGINLLPHQKSAIEKVIDKDFGVIVSPPGSGKTIIGLEIIAQKMQPALILVHRKQIFDQWLDRIQNFLESGPGSGFLHKRI